MNKQQVLDKITKDIEFVEKDGKIIRHKVKEIIRYLLTYDFKSEDFELMDVYHGVCPLEYSIILNTNCYLIISSEFEGNNVKLSEDKFGTKDVEQLFCAFNTEECKNLKEAAHYCITNFVREKYAKMLDSVILRE